MEKWRSLSRMCRVDPSPLTPYLLETTRNPPFIAPNGLSIPAAHWLPERHTKLTDVLKPAAERVVRIVAVTFDDGSGEGGAPCLRI